MLQGFKDFIARGNAIDLAVGVIVGAAFSEVISSLTDSVLNPLIGAIFGKPDFTEVGQFEIQLLGDPAVVSPGAVVTALLNFLIVAFALYFFIVVPLNKLASKKDEPEDVPAEVELLTQIRDTLQEVSGGGSGGEHSKS